LWSKDSLGAKEIRKTILFKYSKKIKYLGINSIKELKGLYSETYQSLKKEIEDTRKWEDLPCS
jgi:hypothetical protein